MHNSTVEPIRAKVLRQEECLELVVGFGLDEVLWRGGNLAGRRQFPLQAPFIQQRDHGSCVKFTPVRAFEPNY